jgi:hypothetical protein
MKNKYIIWLILAVIIFFGIIGYSIYRTMQFENAKLNVVDLSDSKNIVTNLSSTPHLDTVAHLMMEDLNLQNVEIVILDVSDNARSTIFSGKNVNGFVVERFDGVLQVFIYPFESRLKTYQTLAHELVHVSQLANGRLKIINASIGIWEGDTVNVSSIEYSDRKWEQEAFNKQSILFKNVREILTD